MLNNAVFSKFLEKMGKEPIWREATDTTVKNFRNSGISPASDTPKGSPEVSKQTSPIPLSPELKVNGGVIKIAVHPNERIAPPEEYGKPAKLKASYLPKGRNEAFVDKSIGELLVLQGEILEEINYRKCNWRDHLVRLIDGQQFPRYLVANKMCVVAKTKGAYTVADVDHILSNPTEYEHSVFYDMEDAISYLHDDSFVKVDLGSPRSETNSPSGNRKSHRTRVLIERDRDKEIERDRVSDRERVKQRYTKPLSQSESALTRGLK